MENRNAILENESDNIILENYDAILENFNTKNDYIILENDDTILQNFNTKTDYNIVLEIHDDVILTRSFLFSEEVQVGE